MVGFKVNKPKPRISLRSSSSRLAARAGLPSSSNGRIFSSTALVATASLSPPLAVLVKRVTAFDTVSKSASASSVLMVAISSSGSILPLTWMTFSSSKQRTTWAIASVSRMLARNWLPRPSPFEAPATRPAISTNSMVVGRTRCGFTMAASLSKRASGTGTIPVFGSMVQNGKFSAAIAALVKALKRVDLPTLGRPTIPQLKPMKWLTKCYSKIVADFTWKPA